MKHIEKKFTARLNIWRSSRSIVKERNVQTTVSLPSCRCSPLGCNSRLKPSCRSTATEHQLKEWTLWGIRGYRLWQPACLEFWFRGDESQEVNPTGHPVPQWVIHSLSDDGGGGGGLKWYFTSLFRNTVLMPADEKVTSISCHNLYDLLWEEKKNVCNTSGCWEKWSF